MSPIGHPAPHRDRVALWRQLAGFFAAPVAFGIQLNVGYSLTSYACNPRGDEMAVMVPGWDWTRAAALAVNLAAALVAVWAGLVALGVWRMTRDERHGHPMHGEGRTRFMGVWGVFTSFGFLAATLFDTVMILGAPACRG